MPRFLDVWMNGNVGVASFSMISISPFGTLISSIDMVPILFTCNPWVMISPMIVVHHVVHEDLCHEVDQLILSSFQVI